MAYETRANSISKCQRGPLNFFPLIPKKKKDEKKSCQSYFIAGQQINLIYGIGVEGDDVNNLEMIYLPFWIDFDLWHKDF